jgi:hypothetical protein
MNALTSPMGIMKVGNSACGEVDIDGQMFPIGRPYAKVVDLDDWVHDSCAKTWDEIAFCGNRYRVPLSWAKSCPLFDPEVAANLQPTEKYRATEDGGQERVSTLSVPDNQSRDEYQEYVELWDIYLPYENKIMTISRDAGEEKPLHEAEYDGYKGGPYHALKYLDVPNNLCGVPPAAHWVDMHDAMNSIMRKLIRQAKREKQILCGADAEDVKRVVNSNDGDAILIQNPKGLEEKKFGGPDAATAQFEQMLEGLASRYASNLDSMGGLGAQTETLGQDQLISSSNSKQMQEMQDRTVKAIKEVVRHLAWLQWVDQLQDIEAVKDIAGYQIPSVVTPDQRANADFMLFNVDIVPYSMEIKTPAQKLQAVLGMTGQLLPVVLPMLQQQGDGFDVKRLWNDVAEMSGVDELKDLIIHQMTPPPVQPGTPQQPPAVKPPVTKRTYERKNVGGATREARGAQMQNSMRMLAAQSDA